MLALLALALVTLLAWQWWDWPPPAPGPNVALSADSPTEARSQPAENPIDLLTPPGEKEDYLAVTERPLFMPDRRPPKEESEEEAATGPELPSDLDRLDLNAVLITPSESSAWVRDPSNKKLVRLRLGDELDGWSVKEIRSDRILLERQGEKDTLVLRDYKNSPPPTQRKSAVRKLPESTARQSRVRKPLERQHARRPHMTMPTAGETD